MRTSYSSSHTHAHSCVKSKMCCILVGADANKLYFSLPPALAIAIPNVTIIVETLAISSQMMTFPYQTLALLVGLLGFQDLNP